MGHREVKAARRFYSNMTKKSQANIGEKKIDDESFFFAVSIR
jgi:hypothetical protein